MGYAVLLGIAPKRHSSRCKTRRVGATRFLTPTLIKLSGYSGARSPRPSSTCFRRLGTTIALLLAPLPSALRLFRDWLCRDVALETSQRSSPQQGVQVVDGCGRLHWLLGHVSSDNFDGTLSGASSSQPSLSSALDSVRRTCGISLQVPMHANLSMDAANRQ